MTDKNNFPYLIVSHSYSGIYDPCQWVWLVKLEDGTDLWYDLVVYALCCSVLKDKWIFCFVYNFYITSNKFVDKSIYLCIISIINIIIKTFLNQLFFCRYSDEETLEESDENYYVETTSPDRETPDGFVNQIRTGLSQSNMSLTSTSGQNYCYGNQQGYDTGSYGYPIYYGYVNVEPPRKLENRDKPKITSAVYKNRDNSKASIDLLADGPLLSDLLVRNTKNDNDPIQEEQTRLGNQERTDEQIAVKRSSQRILRGSPKFGKLQNDVFLQETDVRTVEYENKGYENNDTAKS